MGSERGAGRWTLGFGVGPARSVAMRNSLFSASVIAAVSGAVLFPDAARGDLQDYLVAHYEFEGNPNATVGPDGTAQGNPTYDTGRFGQAIVLDGDGDYVAVPGAGVLDFGTQDFAIGLWFKTDVQPLAPDGSNGTGLINKRNQYFHTAAGYSVGFNEVSKHHGISAILGDSSGTKIRTDPSPPDPNGLCDGNWHKVLVTYDRDGLCSIYVDDMAIPYAMNDISSQPGSVSNGFDLVIGAWARNSSSISGAPVPDMFFEGMIDDVRIYNAVPEPATIGLLALGALAAARRRR
jgi:hypothetical protein